MPVPRRADAGAGTAEQAPASAGATAGQAADGTPGPDDKAATELASLKPGFEAKDLASALNDSKLNFASASAELPAEMTDFLKRAADEMKRLPRGQVSEIAVYTDGFRQPHQDDDVVAETRRGSTRGADQRWPNPDMLVAKGYGSADPIASNDTPESRLRNRRIEFHVVRTP